MEHLTIRECKLLILEPFYGGSHKALIDSLTNHLRENGVSYSLVTLPAKKWHWRARCGSLQIYEKIAKVTTEKVLWCSSVLNLAELLGLRPDLHKLRKIVYFHENQLIYPVQKIKSRDVQYAYNQITTCLAADEIIFNSIFNKTSFLENIQKVINFLPDNKPTYIKLEIEVKCKVLYFPISFPKTITNKRLSSVLHIVWPHRWEFDKGPEDLFNVVLKLKNHNHKFRLSVLGEQYIEIPDVFNQAKQDLETEIVHFGYLENKNEYFEVLSSSHVVVSTAKHEFFGVSMLEATYCGCLPLVPNNLVYPEIYPRSSIYSDLDHLFEMMKQFCSTPDLAVKLRQNLDIDFNKFSDKYLLPEYLNLINNI